MITVFGFGMLESMAVKPGGGDASPAPRRSPSQQTAESTNSVEIVTATNSPPWETTLAFSHIEATPSNAQLTVAWPLGFFDYDPFLDLFITSPQLTNVWQWVASQTAASTATNCTFTVTPSTLGLLELPSALYARVTERTAACKAMDDPDGDGVPNPFEFHHGTNPYVSDAYRIQTLDCTNASISTLKTVLANSTEYSIINLPTGTIDAADSIVMPPHPVLLSGPSDGYTVIKSTTDLGTFTFKDGQDSHTLIRNIYLDLVMRKNFQVGFWCGGNLPWEGVGASPSFVNIVIRMPRPEPFYIGWLFYGDTGELSVLSNCMINAFGSTKVRGIDSINGPSIRRIGTSFFNLPSNGVTSLVRTLRNPPVTNECRTVNCLVADDPTPFANRHDSGATCFIDLAPTADSDGDGISNLDELADGTDPWLDDTDGDGVSDPDELAFQTDPTNLYSFIHGVIIHVTNTVAVQGATVSIYWHREGHADDMTFLTNSPARQIDCPLALPHTDERIIIVARRDLNGNAIYDPSYDLEQSAVVSALSEFSHVRLDFGDVDHDGIADHRERSDGTDPYSANSLRITRTVELKDDDYILGITNYFSQGTTKEWIADAPSDRILGTSRTLSVDTNAISGYVYVKCYRDFNRNGVYDQDCEPLYVFSISNQKDNDAATFSVSLKDRDGDTIPDSVEWSEGTDMNDHFSYCYSATLTVTGIFTTTNNLCAQPFFGTTALAAAHMVCTNQEEYVFAHSSTTNYDWFAVKYWYDLNGNLSLDDGEAYSIATVNPHGHETSLVYDLPYSRFDANNNKLPDWWEITTGLSTNSVPHDWYDDTDHDGLINLHEYWTGCDPLTPDGSNTVLSILARSIDDRLTDNPTGRMNVYNNYCKPDFYPNTNCWAYGIDLSCASPTNTHGGTQRAGTAITSQHIVLAEHFGISKYTTMCFMGTTGELVERTIELNENISSTDIRLSLLNTDLPPCITPAKILPENYREYIGTGAGLPILMLDQDEHAIVANLNPLHKDTKSSFGTKPKQERRKLYYEDAIGGDSGDPVFLIFGNEPVLIHALYGGGGGSGPFLTYYKEAIQSKLDSMSVDNGAPVKSIQTIDFSNNPRIIREAK